MRSSTEGSAFARYRHPDLREVFGGEPLGEPAGDQRRHPLAQPAGGHADHLHCAGHAALEVDRSARGEETVDLLAVCDQLRHAAVLAVAENLEQDTRVGDVDRAGGQVAVDAHQLDREEHVDALAVAPPLEVLAQLELRRLGSRPGGDGFSRRPEGGGFLGRAIRHGASLRVGSPRAGDHPRDRQIRRVR
jgi:hypothetical protein